MVSVPRSLTLAVTLAVPVLLLLVSACGPPTAISAAPDIAVLIQAGLVLRIEQSGQGHGRLPERILARYQHLSAKLQQTADGAAAQLIGHIDIARRGVERQVQLPRVELIGGGAQCCGLCTRPPATARCR